MNNDFNFNCFQREGVYKGQFGYHGCRNIVILKDCLTCGDGDEVGGVSPLLPVPALQHHAVLSLAGQSVHHKGPPGGEEGVHHGGGGVTRHWPVTQLTLTHTAVQLN